MEAEDLSYIRAILHQLTRIDQTQSEQELKRMIRGMLQVIGENTDAARVFLFERSDTAVNSYSNTFEWCAKGTASNLTAHQNVRLHPHSMWMKAFSKGECVVISDVEKIKDLHPQEYAYMKGKDLTSILLAPVFFKDRLSGFIGMDDPKIKQPEIMTQLLTLIGSHLGSTREHFKMLRLLEKKQEYLRQSLEEKKKEKQVLTVLCADYTSVFLLDLNEDTLETIKLNSGANAAVMLDAHTKECYSKKIRDYFQYYVIKETAEDFLDKFEIQNLKKILKDQKCVVYRYQSVPNVAGHQFFEIKVERIEDESHHLKAVMGYRHIDDIVKEERQNQKNREAALENERLNRENEAKSEFLSRMSHDIRTPMNAIMGLVDIAQGNPDDPGKLKECIGKIGTAGKNLQQLVNDVLDITQIESGEFKIRTDQMNLHHLLSYIRQIFDDMALKKGICFVYEEQGITRSVLMADELRLTQVYMNLLSNALKYTQEGGTVFLKVQEKEIPGTQKVELVSIIRDTGIGMEKEFMDVMYSKFSRAVDTRVNKVRGSGLGLSIVKKIVDLLDGKIEVHSVPEHGTTFKVTLRLPYCEEMQEQEEPKEIAFDRTIKLLVAEDNDLNYEIEQELLAMHGIQTERACDGEVCVRKVREAKEGTYDAILMDMQMPVMDGVMAARKIRSLALPWAKKIPIIAMTANAFREDVQRCLDAGMDAHLAKPMELEKLLAALHRCLAEREGR